MSKKLQLAAKNIEQILEKLASGTCSNGCKCIFCRTFDAGYQSGLEDAAVGLNHQLAEFTAKLGKQGG